MEERVIFTLEHVVNKRFQHKRITLESRLREDLNVDPIDFSLILADLEDEFETTLSDVNFDDVVTVNDLVEKLRGRGIPEYEVFLN